MTLEPPNEFISFTKKGSFLSALYGHGKKADIWKSGRQLSPRLNLLAPGAPTKTPQPPKQWERNVCCLSPTVPGSLLQQPNLTKANSNDDNTITILTIMYLVYYFRAFSLCDATTQITTVMDLNPFSFHRLWKTKYSFFPKFFQILCSFNFTTSLGSCFF